tara:strand:- start:1729 stop:1896 length:168 start_codon:yes stop_codon:yes gene_type:complete
MRVLGWILRKFFAQNEPKYWLSIPKFVNSRKEKQEMIKKYEKFVNKNVIIKDGDK